MAAAGGLVAAEDLPNWQGKQNRTGSVSGINFTYKLTAVNLGKLPLL